jgi:hypothetical protein
LFPAEKSDDEYANFGELLSPTRHFAPSAENLLIAVRILAEVVHSFLAVGTGCQAYLPVGASAALWMNLWKLWIAVG